ncbi:hypothetical protein D3C75_1113980 [compost metagenome]
MAPIMIQEIKYGKNMTLCVILMNHLLRSSFNIMAIATEKNVPVSIYNAFSITVLRVALRASSMLEKKNSKLEKPAQGLPKMPSLKL